MVCAVRADLQPSLSRRFTEIQIVSAIALLNRAPTSREASPARKLITAQRLSFIDGTTLDVDPERAPNSPVHENKKDHLLSWAGL